MLHAAGIENALQEGRWLAVAACGGSVPAHGYCEDDARERGRSLASRRVAGEPLQYVTGVAGFRRLELAVGPGVFVPRPETEIVTEHAMGRLPAGGTLVDVGTGSGAIALAVADERPDAAVLATEAFPEALEWARRNVAVLGLEVRLFEGHLLDPLPPDLRGKVDVVVSNPPYIAQREEAVLPRDVVDHEPHEALFAGADALSVISSIVPSAEEWLKPGGWLVFEISSHLQTAVPEVLRERGFEEVSVHDDLAGRPRVVEGRKP